MKEEVAAKAKVEFGVRGKALAKTGEAIMASEDVAYFQSGGLVPEGVQPLNSCRYALFFVVEVTPAEVKGVSVQDEEIDGFELGLNFFEKNGAIRTTCEEVKVMR